MPVKRITMNKIIMSVCVLFCKLAIRRFGALLILINRKLKLVLPCEKKLGS